MRTIQIDDDLDTPVQLLVSVVSTHVDIICKLEIASNKFFRDFRHKGITLRKYYLKFKDILRALRDTMDLMITLMKQTSQKMIHLENINRRIAKCTVQRMLRSTHLFLNVTHDMFKSLLKTKQVLLNLTRRLSKAAKDMSIDCRLLCNKLTNTSSTKFNQ